MPRLIDADALMIELNNTKYAWQDYDAVEDALRNIPTIEAEPVRHGRWIEHDDGVFTCSECGNAESIESYFCGYCGAKMDKGE